MLRRRELDLPRFPPERLAALSAAILVDDEIDAHTELPDHITLDFDRRRLVDCFRLSRQLWIDGIDRGALLGLVDTLAREHDLGGGDRLRFKDARARFKHLRFAFALYAADHRYPWLVDQTTIALGRLQDAFKAGRTAAVRREAALCRLLLARFPYSLLMREIDRLDPVDGPGFRGYVIRQVETLGLVLAQGAVTGARFHETRKIISRQTSFYDTLRTITPEAEAFRMSRSLAAINGLMGAMHDDLVERRAEATQDYHRDRFALPIEIRSRLEALLAGYETAIAGR